MNRKFSTIKNEKGQGLVEYALLSVFVSIVLIGVLTAFGPEIKVLATSLMDSFTGGDFSVHEGELIIPGISPSLTPTATPVPTWTTCANENGFCSFSGPAQVRYGANDIWVIQTYTNGVSCTNAVFGDPISGVAKTCQVYPINSSTPIASPSASASPTPTASSTPTASPTPTALAAPSATPVLPWINCANENGVCSFSGTALVRYGANDIWVTQTHTNGVSCTNAIFGDPISGVVKTCQIYQIASSTPIPLPTPTALACTSGNATVANESACSALSTSNNCQNYIFRRWNGKCTWY